MRRSSAGKSTRTIRSYCYRRQGGYVFNGVRLFIYPGSLSPF